MLALDGVGKAGVKSAAGEERGKGAAQPMLIAQITDMHLGFDPDNPAEFNRKRLDRVIHLLAHMDRRPDLVLATGDLVDRGDVASYRRLREALEALPVPAWPCLGNHDDRAHFRAVFPEIPVADGFVQYAIDAGPLRLLVLDTLEEGRHGGAFCETRARWLADRVAEAPDRPTMIVLHHPPIDTGIAWMTTDPEEAWIGRLDAALAGHRNIVAMVGGHIHRPMVAGWRGRPMIVCPSTAPQVALTLAPMDPALPDDRPMIVAGAPGFALHQWTGETLVTHFDAAEDHAVLARFDERMQPLVTALIGERGAG